MPSTKLTLADLDRFLAVETEDAGLPAYRQAAAVLSAFDPFELQPLGETPSAKKREKIVAELLALCELLTQGVEGGLWSLSLTYRRETLRELGTRDSMKKALAANPERPATPVQRMFDRLLEAAPLPLEELSRQELAATLEAIEWVDGILDNLPSGPLVHQQLTRTDLLAPMKRLVGRGFVGREKELDQISQYVFGPKQPEPLFVFGPGGVGKSTLLAQFVLARATPNDVAIVYVDIDRPVILPEKPLTILLEAINQLRPQLDIPSGAIESLEKEVTYAIARFEGGRSLESASGTEYSWIVDLFKNSFDEWIKGKSVLLIVDTLEEAQYMGSDVMWPLIEFLISLNRAAPWCKVVLSGRTLPHEYVQLAFPNVPKKTDETVEDPKFLERIPLLARPLNVSVLEPAPALKLIRSSLSELFAAEVKDADLKDVIGLVGGNPMVLKLAARLLEEEGVDKLRTERSELFAKLKAEKIQALLYGRILRHVHDDDVRKVAYPGLIVRRIDPKVIRDVLAVPCKLVLTTERNEHKIFVDLSKEAALVYIDPEDGSLRHRADVRRAMLEDLTDHVPAALVEEINRSAVRYYRKLPGPIARAEELYHLLRLGESEAVLNERWSEDAARHLQGSLEELRPQQRLWLAERLNVTLDKSVRETASQEKWESQAVRSVNRYLASQNPKEALTVLHERKTRAPRSQLYELEAESYRFLKDYKTALVVARIGVEALTKVGAIDMALELLLKMVVIEEGRGDLVAAEKLLCEAVAISKHSSNDVLQLRVKTTGLRLQRQLHPEAVDERQSLRKEATELLNEEMLHKLQAHPVLLREVAAELAKQDPRLASVALEALGVEVATDEQAKAFGSAVAGFNLEPNVKARKVNLKGYKEVENSTDPKVIREWVTQVMNRSDTKKLSKTLADAEAGSVILDGFRDYFRVGVDTALKGKS